jgi:hypothetical protein
MSLALKPPEQRRSIRLRDNRLLAMSEWGPVGDVPVRLCTGAGMSSWLGFGSEHVEELGIRLICIDRPGLVYPIHTLRRRSLPGRMTCNS